MESEEVTTNNGKLFWRTGFNLQLSSVLRMAEEKQQLFISDQLKLVLKGNRSHQGDR